MTKCGLMLLAAAFSLTLRVSGSEAEVPELVDVPSKLWTIPARQLPPPMSASESLYQQIAENPQPKSPVNFSSKPIDSEQWKALVAANKNKNEALDLASLESVFNVKVTETNVAGVVVHRVLPNRNQADLMQAAMIYLHGGAYVFNSGLRGAYEAIIIASYAGVAVWSVDYRTSLLAPFPAAFEDALKVYRALAEDPNIKTIALGGTSAGAGLALAITQDILDTNIVAPDVIYAGSPWADLTKTGDTLYSLEGIDRVLVSYDGLLGQAAKLYAGSEPLTNPRVSPLYGSFANFPPTYLASGTRDLLLSDTVRVHRAIKQAGGHAEINVFEGLSHAEYLTNLDMEESQRMYLELAAFLKLHLSYRDKVD
jgi:monoterpene epsilon-lactone hydrolase